VPVRLTENAGYTAPLEERDVGARYQVPVLASLIPDTRYLKPGGIKPTTSSNLGYGWLCKHCSAAKTPSTGDKPGFATLSA